MSSVFCLFLLTLNGTDYLEENQHELKRVQNVLSFKLWNSCKDELKMCRRRMLYDF